MTDQRTEIFTAERLGSGFEADQTSHLTVSLQPGQHLAISGPSGCGKSSLLQVIAGLLPPAGGTIQWQQNKIKEQNLPWWRQQFCYLPQQAVMGGETILKALLLPWHLKALNLPEPTHEKCLQVLVSLGISHSLEQPTHKLSGGEKQRLAIARALLMERTLWLMDEPTSALDPASRNKVIELIAKQSLTVISVSHDPVWVNSAQLQHVMGGSDE
ncbi:ATP-binding cassette domain-containing protein [Photobacterium rosenbergii]|uniref:ATP-binding cassette domain-containing protein n=1 Tax=Photobacterium rosenbergii TaxID=294936 RepID=A0ABU3ZDJ9_9GAMM|nr:ATP-binding cassette domain-containing protein [Photobacterium rosenbergii]MDV5168171.1 ATP-binding cassette domain-containing protein [Photobacterium rosenbergii]